MNLPNLFLADLPPTLEMTPGMIREACAAISRNRDQWLAPLRTRQIVEIIAYTAEQWLVPENGFRTMALSAGARECGFGPATVARGLDSFFRSLTVENLEGLMAQDLGDGRKLDDFSGSVPEVRTGRSSMTFGPRLLAHVTAGNLPIPALQSIVMGLLVKSAQFVKCASGASLIPRLFVHSLAHTESKVASCTELATWTGGRTELEDALFGEADCVTATGSDEAVHALRRRVPHRARFVGYGHRVSFAYVTEDLLSSYGARRVVRDAAADITAWNQLGCLSPHVIYVEERGVTSPEGFAELLAAELAEREKSEPRGPLPIAEAARIAGARDAYAMRAAQKSDHFERRQRDSVFTDLPKGLRVFSSEDSTAWTVVYEEDPRFKVSCLHRFIYVKPVAKLADVLRYAEVVRHQVSTVAIAAVENRAVELARDLGRWGVSRVCALGKMQEPPLAWRHDGRPALGELVRWTDFEL